MGVSQVLYSNSFVFSTRSSQVHKCIILVLIKLHFFSFENACTSIFCCLYAHFLSSSTSPWSPNKSVTVTVLQTEVSWYNRKTLVQTDCLCLKLYSEIQPTLIWSQNQKETILEIVSSNYSMASNLIVFMSIMAAKKEVLVGV